MLPSEEPEFGQAGRIASGIENFDDGGSCGQAGEGGQIYRREAPGSWLWLDPNLEPMDATPFLEAGDRVGDDIEALLAIDMSPVMDDSRRKAFTSLGGSSDQSIYATGYDGALLFWDGTRSHWVEGLPKTQLTAILPDGNRNVWVCGSQGTLLFGNFYDGFKDISPKGEFSFNSIAKYNGEIYLTANGGFGGPVGLYLNETGVLRQVLTGLKPEIEDVSVVTSTDGLLWVVGAADIVCFDGTDWEPISKPEHLPHR